MCGIAGIVRFDQQPVERTVLERMLAHVRHRGPDGCGIAEHGPCAFAHARLSIIDPPGGAQPMFLPSFAGWRNLSVVFNGEIYNHRQLRKLLEKLGHNFQTDHSDTEVLLHGYRQWGTDLPRRLEGMFAFAIWDSDEHTLFLCRDRAGKKPLYIRQAPGQLWFASLPATLAVDEHGSMVPINRQALRTFLRFGYTFEDSLLQGVRELPAASWMHIDAKAGRIQSERYWQLPEVSRTTTSLGLLRALGELIETAVETRLEADVPLGCFLSGGIDSSIIAAVAQKLLKQRGEPALRTFCVGMPAINYDERAYARQLAQHIGAEHIELEARPEDVMADLTRLMAVMGEPTADSSILPTLLLCRHTREHVKVALSGDGGDELFAGYDRYRAMSLLRQHAWWLGRLPARMLRGSDPRSMPARVKRLLHAAGADRPAARYLRMIALFEDDQMHALGIEPDEAWADAPLPDWEESIDPTKAAMRWDLKHYLPFDLLRKMDRASMSVALEVRCPLLDSRIYELAAHLPTPVLMPRGRPKSLLRQVGEALLPSPILRRPKRGFALPIGSWFAGPLSQTLRDHLTDGSLVDLGFDAAYINRLYDEHVQGRQDHTHRLFALLDLAVWMHWRRNPMPATD